MEAEIDYGKILMDHYGTSKEWIIDAMKEAVKASIPIILKEVSEKVKLKGEFKIDDHGFRDYRFTDVDKSSILNLEGELINKLTK